MICERIRIPHPPQYRPLGPMKSRLLAALAFAGALAYACGPRPRASDATAASLRTTPLLTASTLAHRAATVDPATFSATTTINRDGIKLDATFAVHVGARAVRFTLDVKDAGRKHVELSFPNGQVYDFVVIDSTGTEVWRWAAGRIFTQTVRNKALAKGDVMHIEEKWSPASITGHFTAIATLKSSNYPIEQRVEFEIPGAVNLATTR